MTETTPTLYILNRNYSSWSLRGWIALRALNIKFDTVELIISSDNETKDLFTPEANALMARAGPTGKVPALHVTKPNGEKHIVFESLALMEYLAEDHPSLWPADKYERAYARSLASEMATSFGALRNYAMNVRAVYPFDAALYTPAVEKNLLRISAIWEELRSKAAQNKDDKGYLFGSFTALDAMYAPLPYRLIGYSLVDKIQGKHAQAYVQHMLNSPEMQEWTKDSKLEPWIIPADELYPISAPSS
ncbi:Glutathione S-transferase 8 [Mortierella antarctica]|nr:Glutathione S-transferase 8 [Mortierella antarctica]